MSPLRHLSMGNISVDAELMYVIFKTVLPSLYSLDIFNLKCTNGLQQSKMFLPLRELLEHYPNRAILIRLRISQINLQHQLDAIVDLILYAQESLLDLELSWCNLNLNNFITLSNCIKKVSHEDAECYNGGVRRGTLRKLNFSYNPFTKPGQRIKGPNLQNLDYLEGQNVNAQESEIFRNLEPDDEDEGSCFDNHDDDDELDSDTNLEDCHHHENFTDAFINLVKSQNMSRCTHLDLSGIDALNQNGIMELMNELFDYQYCENLLSIHLNDLGINFNSRIKDDIIELFRIQTVDE